MTLDLEAELDALYAAPLSDFVAQRNQLARALKQDGQKAEAERIGKLGRPSAAAWIINQLHFRHEDTLTALLDSGSALRRAQEALAPAGEFAEHKRMHQQALRLATEAAIALAEGAGMSVNAGLRRKLELSLSLLSAAAEGTVQSPGRTQAEPEPAGFDAFAAAEMPAKPPPTASRQRSEAERRAAEGAARAAIAAIEKELAQLDAKAIAAHDRHERAAQEAAEAEHRAEVARRARDEARRDAEAAKTQADEARGQLARQKKALES